MQDEKNNIAQRQKFLALARKNATLFGEYHTSTSTPLNIPADSVTKSFKVYSTVQN